MSKFAFAEHRDRAMEFIDAGRLSEAFESLKKALRDPAIPECELEECESVYRAFVYVRRELARMNPDRERQYLQEFADVSRLALGRHPNANYVRLRLGTCLLTLGAASNDGSPFREALDVLIEHWKRDPLHKEGVENLCLAYAANGMPDKASELARTLPSKSAEITTTKSMNKFDNYSVDRLRFEYDRIKDDLRNAERERLIGICFFTDRRDGSGPKGFAQEKSSSHAVGTRINQASPLGRPPRPPKGRSLVGNSRES